MDGAPSSCQGRGHRWSIFVQPDAVVAVLQVDTKDALLHAISEEYVEAVEVLLEHEGATKRAGEPHVSLVDFTKIPPVIHGLPYGRYVPFSGTYTGTCMHLCSGYCMHVCSSYDTPLCAIRPTELWPRLRPSATSVTRRAFPTKRLTCLQ